MTKFIDFDEISVHSKADASPGLLLWRTYLVWKRKIEISLLPHEITHMQFVLLAGLGYLAKNGALVTQQSLAKFTCCDVTMTSQVLRGLEKKGLIQRIQKEGDERAKYPQVTLSGLAKLKKAMKDVEAVDAQFFGVLGKKTQGFVRNLQMMLDA